MLVDLSSSYNDVYVSWFYLSPVRSVYFYSIFVLCKFPIVFKKKEKRKQKEKNRKRKKGKDSEFVFVYLFNFVEEFHLFVLVIVSACETYLLL